MKKIYIELSDICALSCQFCPAPKSKRGIMDLQLFEHCINEAIKICKNIALHILGDPCKLENLSQYLSIAKAKGAHIDLVTSGMYLHKHHYHTLISKPIKQISISLEAGFDRNNYHTNYLQRVVDFALYHRANPLCFLNLRIQDSGILQQERQLQDIFSAFCIAESNITDLMAELRQQGRLRLWERAFLVVKRHFEWTLSIDSSDSNNSDNSNGSSDPKNNHKIHKKCYGISEQIGILSNGIVVPCCIDAMGIINLGNIKTQNLESILSSPRAVRIREGFKHNLAIEPLCQQCQYYIAMQ